LTLKQLEQWKLFVYSHGIVGPAWMEERQMRQSRCKAKRYPDNFPAVGVSEVFAEKLLLPVLSVGPCVFCSDDDRFGLSHRACSFDMEFCCCRFVASLWLVYRFLWGLFIVCCYRYLFLIVVKSRKLW